MKSDDPIERELAEVREAFRDFEAERRRARRAAERRAPGGRRSPARRRLRLALAAAVGLLLLSVLVPPYRYPVSGTVTSGFFLRRKPERRLFLDFEFHRGMDIAAPAGTPVRAARSGFVAQAASSPSYGNYVMIRHPLGSTTVYAHLSRSLVSRGGFVWRGRRIGLVGSTGRATGPHLHFEVRFAGRQVPPGLALLFADLRRALLGR